MDIKGKVHLFFEQSGTFKKQFQMLGYEAYDYDIQNQFGETDHAIDLFSTIEQAYGGGRTLFDSFTEDDLIVAFFPCIYFCAMSQMAFSLGYTNYRKKSDSEKIKLILERSQKREQFYGLLIKFVGICLDKGLRMVLENPWSEQTYLKANFLKAPDIVDMNRMERGDFFKKPTAYWFWNCQPTHGFTHQNDKEQRVILNTKPSGKTGVCSADRSMISSDYARNWICDFILGKDQEAETQMNLF